MEAETVLYFITGVVILTFIAFCYACYCTCREMKLKSSSPSGSSSSRVFWTGNPNTVMTLYPSSLSRQVTQRFRQTSWRTLMQRNRSPTPSVTYPLIAMNSSRSPSFSESQPQGTNSFITVFYERRNSPAGAMSTLAVPEQTHMAINMPTNCSLHSHPLDLQMPPDLPPPSYDEAVTLQSPKQQD